MADDKNPNMRGDAGCGDSEGGGGGEEASGGGGARSVGGSVGASGGGASGGGSVARGGGGSGGVRGGGGGSVGASGDDASGGGGVDRGGGGGARGVGDGESGGAASAAFLLTANDILTAEAYEEMLRKHRIDVIAERREPASRYAAISETRGAAAASPVNLYVSSDRLEQARGLVEEYDNSPVVYSSPPPVLNQKSRQNQILFAFFMVLIFVVPIGIALFVIGTRIIRALGR